MGKDEVKVIDMKGWVCPICDPSQLQKRSAQANPLVYLQTTLARKQLSKKPTTQKPLTDTTIALKPSPETTTTQKAAAVSTTIQNSSTETRVELINVDDEDILEEKRPPSTISDNVRLDHLTPATENNKQNDVKVVGKEVKR